MFKNKIKLFKIIMLMYNILKKKKTIKLIIKSIAHKIISHKFKIIIIIKKIMMMILINLKKSLTKKIYSLNRLLKKNNKYFKILMKILTSSKMIIYKI